MVKYNEQQLDAIFAALSDRTRRGILASLAGTDKSASELAADYDMSLTGFMKHMQVLEGAGLVAREKEGRVVQFKLTPNSLDAANAWLEQCREFWTPRLDALDKYLNEQEHTWSPKQHVRRSASSSNTKQRPRKSGKRGPRSKR